MWAGGMYDPGPSILAYFAHTFYGLALGDFFRQRGAVQRQQLYRRPPA
jgi:hypothetical protein